MPSSSTETEEGCPRSLADGRFVLGERLGEGGSGVVYRAMGPNGPCAVKIRPVPEKQIQAARFLVEPVPMAQVKHPRIVRVIDTGRDGDFYWIAMTLFGRGTLSDLVVAGGPIPVEPALALMEQTLEGLAAVHLAGFVHRDIKPHNIFIDDRGEAVVGDFGVARHVNAKLWFRTQTGQGIGTMGYRAPEQDQDAKSAGPAADVYGVAATLYYCTTGQRPPLLYASDTNPRMLDHLPRVLHPLVVDATRHDPVERIQTAAACWARVRSLRDDLRSQRGEPPLALPAPEGGGVTGWLRRMLGG